MEFVSNANPIVPLVPALPNVRLVSITFILIPMETVPVAALPVAWYATQHQTAWVAKTVIQGQTVHRRAQRTVLFAIQGLALFANPISTCQTVFAFQILCCAKLDHLMDNVMSVLMTWLICRIASDAFLWIQSTMRTGWFTWQLLTIGGSFGVHSLSSRITTPIPSHWFFAHHRSTWWNQSLTIFTCQFEWSHATKSLSSLSFCPRLQLSTSKFQGTN